MLAKSLLPFVAAQAAWAQSLTDVLASQNSTLSTLIGILQQQPELVENLGGLSDITILAPSNEAFSNLFSDPAVASAVQSDVSLVPALLAYHVLNGTFYSSALTSLSESVFPHSLLTDPVFTSLSAGQVVEVQSSNGGVTVLSGNGASSTVTGVDFNFTGGTVHIIDNVLSIPPNLTVALTEGNLTSLASAATQANLVQPLEELEEVTIFAPNNAAFDEIADVAANLSVEQLTGVLGFHVIPGAVVYSSDIEDGTEVTTLQGQKLTIALRDGGVFVNDAQVVMPDVLVKNGVVHVIDSVLIPGATPSASGSATASGTAAATGTATIVPGMGSTTGKGAMGAVALFGGVAALMNM